jgi:hypothetical protein
MGRCPLLVAVLLVLEGLAPPASAGTAVPPGLPTAVASAGDSLTRGFDATLFGCLATDCPQ